ncbi:hypothetical protein BSK59_13570 [Paenibacillus odorifer]|uniref:hypothetical protein n=1 Tax=Paenibacillus odorifer TaxID=189426 RepID=UPI00096C4DB8|nr:hypothetical protein [Paenibacillus odorifer]OME55500.1 hypothetical protein BSK59_13570 [Paenibacillus odorifer]
MCEEYLKKLSQIVINEGLRDTFKTQKRLIELNKMYSSDTVIYHSDNIRGKCIVYYGSITDPAAIDTYEFKLGKVKKEETISNVLKLNMWEERFNNTIRDGKPTLEYIKSDILIWVNESKNNKYKKQFIETLNVFYKYTGQIIVLYKEFNGELKRIKPIYKINAGISLEELYTYAKYKSEEFWCREFTGKIMFVKTYWNRQLGVFFPDSETIKFSEYMNGTQTKEKIFDTLVHELVHWHLHTSGKKYRDEDFEFIEECLRVGCGLSDAAGAQRAYRDYCVSLNLSNKNMNMGELNELSI